tara:strand:- start:6 stop:245 length:240 start_codon:yes stop_codon:yes gene_type:complete
MPKHKQAGQTTVLTKMTANIDRKRLQCRRPPTDAVRFMAERCGAASPDRPFVHLAAFSAGEGQQSGLSGRRAIVSRVKS